MSPVTTVIFACYHGINLGLKDSGYVLGIIHTLTRLANVQVKIGDPIVFLGTKSLHHVHAGVQAYADGSLEVNGGPMTGWTVNLFSPYFGAGNYFCKGGDTIRYLHGCNDGRI